MTAASSQWESYDKAAFGEAVEVDSQESEGTLR